MSKMKSIWFPPPVADEMIRAILEGRKTVTRRVVKPQPKDVHNILTGPLHQRMNTVGFDCGWRDGDPGTGYVQTENMSCRPGDILYAREAWCDNLYYGIYPWETERYCYRADNPYKETLLPEWFHGWSQSIHMPREAARIFLRVTDVRVERLQDITRHNAIWEGIDRSEIDRNGIFPEFSPRAIFSRMWDSAVKPADRVYYGWAANPWVWVIEFERCGKPEEKPSVGDVGNG